MTYNFMIKNQIINKIIDYILLHIQQEISVDDIATFCGYSRFYISRIFKSETGESIYSFIKRIKVEQSALRLKIEKQKSITEIGESYGYSASNYATLFREHFNQSPINYRKNVFQKSLDFMFYDNTKNKFESYEECIKKISVEILPDYFVLYERRKGNYKNLSDDWCDFLDTYKDFVTDKTILIERTLEDPSITQLDECLYDVCITVDEKDKRLAMQKTATTSQQENRKNLYPNTMVIQGGKFAIYHYKGFPQMIYSAYQSFFSSWLSNTGYVIDERYGFDIYRKIDSSTLYMELDICIPIR